LSIALFGILPRKNRDFLFPLTPFVSVAGYVVLYSGNDCGDDSAQPIECFPGVGEKQKEDFFVFGGKKFVCRPS
jgi:hypothetical protein